MEKLKEELEKKDPNYEELACNKLKTVANNVKWKHDYEERLKNKNKWFSTSIIDDFIMLFMEEVEKQQNSNLFVFTFCDYSKIDDKRRFICIPFCNNTHFVLVVWDQEDQTLTVYDSLEKPNETLAEEAVQNFFTRIRSVENKFTHFKQNKIQKKKTVVIGAQTDCVNCGPFIILFMVCLKHESEITKDKVCLVDIGRFRSYVLYCCINYLYLKEFEIQPSRGHVETDNKNHNSPTEVVELLSSSDEEGDDGTSSSKKKSKQPVVELVSSDDKKDDKKKPKKQKLGASFTKLII